MLHVHVAMFSGFQEPENIATCNIWNNHFASVGPNLGNKLPATDKQIPLFSKKAQTQLSSCLFHPVTAEEVQLEINIIRNDKSYGLINFFLCGRIY